MFPFLFNKNQFKSRKVKSQEKNLRGVEIFSAAMRFVDNVSTIKYLELEDSDSNTTRGATHALSSTLGEFLRKEFRYD